jgi:hypothetical protein
MTSFAITGSVDEGSDCRKKAEEYRRAGNVLLANGRLRET